MTISTKTTIKTFFQTGDFPSASNFSDFIDSALFLAETTAQTIQGSIIVQGSANIAGDASVGGTLSIVTLNAITLNSTTVSASTINAVTGNITTLNASIASAANYKGTPTNNNASTGSIGEYIFSNIPPGSSISLSNGVTSNITFISLQAGDYDVWGTVGFSPGASTTQTSNVGAISLISATLPTAPNNGAYATQAGVAVGIATTFAVGMMRISIATSTAAYLGVNSSFGTSTQAAYGFIGARRVR